jgi:pteridine reductase
MTQLFNNEVVLITGAAKRIGATMARRFHAAGARVVVHYHSSADAALELAAELQKTRPDSVKTVSAQLGDQQSARAVVAAAISGWGRLDILINNASRFYSTPLASVTEQQVADLLGSNFKAPLFLSQAALPQLRERQGCIVNMVDVHASGALSNHCVYGPAKAAVQMLTRILARDLAPEVRVNGISPGSILWPEGDASLDESQQQQVVEGIPMQRNGTPDDIADMALFLCSPAAAYVTGQVIAVDGGRSLG